MHNNVSVKVQPKTDVIHNIYEEEMELLYNNIQKYCNENCSEQW